jgi:hypothetical protein
MLATKKTTHIKENNVHCNKNNNVHGAKKTMCNKDDAHCIKKKLK